jgi:hypothetical protein
LAKSQTFLLADKLALAAKLNLSFVDAGMTLGQAEALVRIWKDGTISYQSL